MISLVDYWQVDRDSFTGECCLADAEEQNTSVASVRAIARLFVIRAVAGYLDGVAAASYCAALLAADDPEAGALRRCLFAIQRNDTFALAGALGEAARLSSVHLALRSARILAELAYGTALEIGAWEQAYVAAGTLERLATMDECPPAAERWSIRAGIQFRRVRQAGTRI